MTSYVNRNNLTGKSRFAATDVALRLVVAEVGGQRWDAAVPARPRALHALCLGGARVAAALTDVGLAAGTSIAW